MSRFFFFNDTATTEIYTLSLHDALPILWSRRVPESSTKTCSSRAPGSARTRTPRRGTSAPTTRSEEHTSELQSPCNLVCRLLLEKKKSRAERDRQGRSARLGCEKPLWAD